MSVTFRTAVEGDVAEAARLVAHSFPAPPRPLSEREEHLRAPRFGGGPEVLLLGEEAGRLVAACQLHPLREWISGAEYPVMGMGTVTISPTARKRGLAAKLVTEGLRLARERGDLLSSLYPFRISFYARLGYGLAGEVYQFRVPPDVFRDSEERARVALVHGEAELAEVADLYARWAPGQTGQVVRSERVWRDLASLPDRAMVAYRSDAGEVEGYARVWYRVDLPVAERYLEVEEIAWITTRARRGLYAWLGSLGDQWGQVVLRALPSERAADWMDEPRLPRGSAPPWALWLPTATLLQGPMYRLLDVPGAWSRRAVLPDADLTVHLEVADAQLEATRGAWTLRLAGGRAEAVAGHAGTPDATLRLDVSALSRIFMGALPASAAVEAGLATAERSGGLPALDRALRLPEASTFDRF